MTWQASLHSHSLKFEKKQKRSSEMRQFRGNRTNVALEFLKIINFMLCYTYKVKNQTSSHLILGGCESIWIATD